MRLNCLVVMLLLCLSMSVFAQWGREYNAGDVITSNTSGTQGDDYHLEFWQENGGENGTMTLGEGCNFSCSWDYNQNILFRKGVRPGGRDEVIVYEADYNPQGNSYLSIYGWFENPLVEYYIIESWGSWKPPNNKSVQYRFESDGGEYTVHSNSRTGASIKGNTTFQQYWSVRTSKRTSGVITCSNHFDAWEKAGLQIGKFYEVSFNVEAYQSGGGSADVKVEMMTQAEYDGTGVRESSAMANPVISPLLNRSTPESFYNLLGQKITGMKRAQLQRFNGVQLNQGSGASGVYFSIPDQK